MGASIGKIVNLRDRSKSYCNQVDSHFQNVKPDFFVKDVAVSDDDIFLAKLSWTIVMSGEETVPFTEKTTSANFNYSSVLTWFYDMFYARFFELCPVAEPLFHSVSMVKQGRLIAAVISSALDSLKHPERLREKLTANTLRHNGKGIKSEWYGKMGDALLWALETVIGEPFDEGTKMAWVRIYSFMLGIILPIAVEHEVKEFRLSSKTTSSKAIHSPKACPFPIVADESEKSNEKSSIWTNRRLDDFYLGSYLKSQFSSTAETSHDSVETVSHGVGAEVKFVAPPRCTRAMTTLKEKEKQGSASPVGKAIGCFSPNTKSPIVVKVRAIENPQQEIVAFELDPEVSSGATDNQSRIGKICPYAKDAGKQCKAL